MERIISLSYYYMNNHWESKYWTSVKEEYVQEIRDIYWPDIFKEKNRPEKIRVKENNYIMFPYMSDTIYLNLLKKLSGWENKKLGFSYLWYLQVLINSTDFSNKVDFNVYRSYGISDSMIKNIRKRFKDAGIVKNIGRDFYINPNIARKWQEIPMYVLDLYK